MAILFSVALAFIYRAIGTSGLTATVTSAGRSLAAPLHVSHERILAWPAVEALIAKAGDRSARIHWSGHLLVPESRDYEMRVVADAPVRLWLQGRVVFDNRGDPHAAAASVRLTSGQHLVGIDFGPVVRGAVFDFQWSVGNPYRLTSVPLEALSPRPLTATQWRLRKWAPRLALTACALWSMLILCIMSMPFWRAGRRELEWSPALAASFGAMTALFAVGAWWGGTAGWAPDEVDPGTVLDAVRQGFAGDWYPTIYPPLHYYLLAALSSPAIVADRLGWLSVDSASTQTLMVLTGRLLSVAMGLAALLGVALLASRIVDRTHAWPAVLCAGAFLPFPFYAKMANVDVPYVCWFVWSLVFLVQLYTGGRARDAVALGITAAAAVATKDQAYGLYVLPAALLVWRFGRSRKGWILLVTGALSTMATLALCYNVVFNPSAAARHLEFITGEASSNYRMFPPTLEGQWHLLQATTGQLVSALGAAGVVLVLASLGSPRYGKARSVFALMLLCVLSYYVTFVAVAGYVYDRFLLPVSCVLAVCAAIGTRRLLGGPKAARIAAVVLLAWVGTRAASLDLLLLRDSRFAAEEWLQAEVRPGQTVGVVSQFGYLPRFQQFTWTWLSPNIPGTLLASPDFIVINREYVERLRGGEDEREWIEWLESGSGLYEEAFRYKAALWYLPLGFDRRFKDRVEDGYTNLDKINPEIVIFRKRQHVFTSHLERRPPEIRALGRGSARPHARMQECFNHRHNSPSRSIGRWQCADQPRWG